MQPRSICQGRIVYVWRLVYQYIIGVASRLQMPGPVNSNRLSIVRVLVFVSCSCSTGALSKHWVGASLTRNASAVSRPMPNAGACWCKKPREPSSTHQAPTPSASVWCRMGESPSLWHRSCVTYLVPGTAYSSTVLVRWIPPPPYGDMTRQQLT